MKINRFYAFVSEVTSSLSLTDNYIPRKSARASTTGDECLRRRRKNDHPFLASQFRPDNARNQVRASQSLARRLYVFGLGAGVSVVVYLFIGSLVLLDASGLVVQQREIVTPPFEAQVLSFTARPG